MPTTSSVDDDGDRRARVEAMIEQKREAMGSWSGFERVADLFRHICAGDEYAEPQEPTDALWEGAVWGILLPPSLPPELGGGLCLWPGGVIARDLGE